MSRCAFLPVMAISCIVENNTRKPVIASSIKFYNHTTFCCCMKFLWSFIKRVMLETFAMAAISLTGNNAVFESYCRGNGWLMALGQLTGAQNSPHWPKQISFDE